MIRTNTKKARQNFCDYVKSYITADEAVEMVETFNRNSQEDIHAPNFGEWLVNYECALECYYNEQRATLQRLLEETDEEANRYDDSRVHSTYKYLVSRAFCEAFGFESVLRYNRAHRLTERLVKAE